MLLALHEHRRRRLEAAGGIRLPLEAGALGRRNEGEEAPTDAELPIIYIYISYIYIYIYMIYIYIYNSLKM